MNQRNYWAFRIDKSRQKFFSHEIHNGRLRQGWGWDPAQDLRNLTMDGGAKRNLPMFKNVKKGDLILVPQLPKWGDVTLLEATEDWDKGYNFELAASQSSDWNQGDYGHIFPIKFLNSFSKNNENVSGNLRSTLRNPGRFWSVNHYSDDIDKLLSKSSNELNTTQGYEARYQSSLSDAFADVFNEEEFKNKLYSNFTNKFNSAEWEYAIISCFKQLFPYYDISRQGGIAEVNHGTDILIKIPSLLSDYQYAIAIQVKDYSGFVGNSASVIAQIKKADSYWENENLKLIEKWIILTKASRMDNPDLANNTDGIKVLFSDDVKDLLSRVGKSWISSEIALS